MALMADLGLFLIQCSKHRPTLAGSVSPHKLLHKSTEHSWALGRTYKLWRETADKRGIVRSHVYLTGLCLGRMEKCLFRFTVDPAAEQGIIANIYHVDRGVPAYQVLCNSYFLAAHPVSNHLQRLGWEGQRKAHSSHRSEQTF